MSSQLPRCNAITKAGKRCARKCPTVHSMFCQIHHRDMASFQKDVPKLPTFGDMYRDFPKAKRAPMPTSPKSPVRRSSSGGAAAARPASPRSPVRAASPVRVAPGAPARVSTRGVVYPVINYDDYPSQMLYY